MSPQQGGLRVACNPRLARRGVPTSGFSTQQGRDLLHQVYDRIYDPAGVLEHRWRKGDIVIWDNRCSYHKAAGDYPPEEDRIHWRVSIKERAA